MLKSWPLSNLPTVLINTLAVAVYSKDSNLLPRCLLMITTFPHLTSYCQLAMFHMGKTTNQQSQPGPTQATEWILNELSATLKQKLKCGYINNPLLKDHFHVHTSLLIWKLQCILKNKLRMKSKTKTQDGKRSQRKVTLRMHNTT